MFDFAFIQPITTHKPYTFLRDLKNAQCCIGIAKVLIDEMHPKIGYEKRIFST